ncbi:hypothetical protein B4107_0907 [Bacillus safensis]|nr:hypothetical protein B4107_0907 [Bacillus safensis]
MVLMKKNKMVPSYGIKRGNFGFFKKKELKGEVRLFRQ